MHLALCDDDVQHLQMVSQMLTFCRNEQMPSLRWTAFQTGFSLLSALEEGARFDAFVLDIFIGDIHGMTLAKTIRKTDLSSPIVFLTSSSDFALEGYDVDAAGYLVKPVTQERLCSTLTKISERLGRSEQDGLIIRSTDGMMTKILLHKLMYLEAHGHFSILYSSDTVPVKTAIPFSALAEQLAHFPCFAQSHRSYLVNLGFVHRIGKADLVLLNGTAIPLSRGHNATFKQRFMDNTFIGGYAR